MKVKTKNLIENIVHGIFLVLGLVTVASVLLITVYLIVSGIPAIMEIGIPDFLLGKKWASTAAEPSYGILPFILTSVYGTAGAIVLGVPVGFMAAVYLWATLATMPRKTALLSGSRTVAPCTAAAIWAISCRMATLHSCTARTTRS